MTIREQVTVICLSAVLCVFGIDFSRAAPWSGEPVEGWTASSPRPQIAPKASVEKGLRRGGQVSLGLAGKGERHVNGWWQKTVPVVAGRHYRFSVSFLARHVELARRSVLARVVWLGESIPRELQREYPPTVAASGGSELSDLSDASDRAKWGRIEGWCTAPEKATQARLELIFRWDADGEVYWDEIAFEPAERPRRPVRLATIYCRPRGSKSPRDSVEKFAELVLKAAEKKPDFICLPEGITIIGTAMKHADVAEPIPGPTTKRLGELAQKANAYLVAGIYERQGETVLNTAVLIGRDGRLLGCYRKAALPDEEIDGGITPGESFPVFQTEFGKVGMMICWDVFFPEPARALSAQGAEIIFLPIWGGNADLIKARPIENQVILVTSSYDARTAIYDRRGEVVAEANADNPIAVAEIDLAETVRWKWLGDFRGRIPREAPPVTLDWR